MSNKFKKRVRAYAKEHGMSYQAAFHAVTGQEGTPGTQTNVVFETEDPTSPHWRAAWGRYVGRLLEPMEDDFVYKIIKEVHHRGWRAGVGSVRVKGVPPGCPRHYTPMERRAWEHGAVAGREAARGYLHASGKQARELH